MGALVLVTTGCGRRGDPLPPLRPYPGAATAVSVRQDGERIRLFWTAPARNTDGTTDKLELAEVEIRRHVIDLPALIEEQTEPFGVEDPEDEDPLEALTPEEALTSEEAPPPEMEMEPAESPEPEPAESPEPGATESTSVEDPSDLESETGLLDEDDEEAGEDEEDTGPVIPPTPVLVVPTFAVGSRDVTTLVSTVPGQLESFEEPVDPSWIGKRLEYAVVYRNEKNRRGERSAIAQIDPMEALARPLTLSTEVHDGYVRVTWSEGEPGLDVPATAPDIVEEPEPEPEPSTDLDAEEEAEEEAEAEDGTDADVDDEAAEIPVGPHYSVFRRDEAAEAYPDLPLNPAPVAFTEFLDRSVTFETPSCYVVRRVLAPPPVLIPEEDDLDALTDEALELLDPDETGEIPDLPETTTELPAAAAELVDPELVADTELAAAEPAEPVEPAEPAEPAEPIVIPDFIVPEVPLLTGAIRIESEASEEVCLTPRDTFALPAPDGLVAVSSSDSVLLTWNDVEGSDVAGYRVYRRPRDSGELVLLSEDLVSVPTFTDEEVTRGETYVYVVTTVDTAIEPNESERSRGSEVTFDPP